MTQSISKYFNTIIPSNCESVIGKCLESVVFLFFVTIKWQMSEPDRWLLHSEEIFSWEKLVVPCCWPAAVAKLLSFSVHFTVKNNNLFQWCGLLRVPCWGFQWGRTRWSSPAGLQPPEPKHTDHPQRNSCTSTELRTQREMWNQPNLSCNFI